MSHSQMFDDLLNKVNNTKLVRGQVTPDEVYKDFASLFVYLTYKGDKKPLVTLSNLTGLPYNTVRSRLDKARQRGLLPKPGKGNHAKTMYKIGER